MNLVIEFTVNDDDCMKILVPELNEKFNYYYQPTKELHIFDQVEVIFEHKDQVISLAQDMVDIVVGAFKYNLEDIINKKKYLSDQCDVGQLGRIYNMHVYNEKDFLDIHSFVIWANSQNITFLYRNYNKIYLEISPKYPLLYDDVDSERSNILFENFMKIYAPIVVLEIDESTIRKWLGQCNAILENVVKPGN